MIWANYLMKIDKNPEDLIKATEAERRRICYVRDISDDDEVEYFPKLSESFIQPKSNDAIFFIEANCLHSGLLNITQR